MISESRHRAGPAVPGGRLERHVNDVVGGPR